MNADRDEVELESVVRRLVQQRVHAQMSAAARSIKYKGPRTIDHIQRLSQQHAEQLIQEIAYDAENPEQDIDDPHKFLLMTEGSCLFQRSQIAP